MHEDARAKLHGTGGVDKTMVVGVLGRGVGTSTSKVVASIQPDRSRTTLHTVVHSSDEVGSTVHTDALTAYLGLAGLYYSHYFIWLSVCRDPTADSQFGADTAWHKRRYVAPNHGYTGDCERGFNVRDSARLPPSPELASVLVAPDIQVRTLARVGEDAGAPKAHGARASFPRKCPELIEGTAVESRPPLVRSRPQGASDLPPGDSVPPSGPRDEREDRSPSGPPRDDHRANADDLPRRLGDLRARQLSALLRRGRVVRRRRPSSRRFRHGVRR